MLGEDVLTVLDVTRFGGLYDTLVRSIAVLASLNRLAGAAAVWVLRRAGSVESA
ncbi:hypothetical protein [Haloarcula onubensis]|uniref:Uncharacterized protein n=1 Tax=Haloarcula onubensis TaxID=2950539 RepID=A0ABU2FPC0_9EURY|nr:hypothetical protein [Halomicroarcula sp. S3CR25-11]MDS0282614.1 hypothetical protein [Halomicroarcula sp. S3CR25-11]